MRKFLGIGILMAAMALPAKAQITPKYEIGGGYQYMAYYSSAGAPRINMNGWDASVTYNLCQRIAVGFDVSGNYNRQSSSDPAVNGATTHVYTYLAGPRIFPFGHHKLSLFGEVLFGEAHVHASIPALPPFPQRTLTDQAYSWTGGAGVDYALGDHWAIRVQGDYLSTRFFSSAAGSQGNERVIAGVVYRFGVRGPRRHK